MELQNFIEKLSPQLRIWFHIKMDILNNIYLYQYCLCPFLEPIDAHRLLLTSKSTIQNLSEEKVFENQKKCAFEIFWKSINKNKDWIIHYRVNLSRLKRKTISLECLSLYFKIDSLMIKMND